MQRKAVLIFCLILFIANSIQVPSRRFNLVFNSTSCVPLTNAVKLFKCDLEKLAVNNYAFSGELIFNKIMHQNFFIRYFIDTKPLSKNISLNFINLKMNICDALERQFEMPLLQQGMIQLRRKSNFPYQCPFKANFPYTVKNYSFSDLSLNNFMPFMHFVQGLNFYESNKMIASFKATGSLLPKPVNEKN